VKRSFLCPACEEPLAPEAVLCINCGFDRRSGEQRTTRVKRLNLDFDVGFPLSVRILLVVLLALVLAGAAVALVLANFPPAGVVGAALGGLLLAIAWLGTFYRLNLRRKKKGNLVLSKHWRFAFVSAGTYPMDLRNYDGVIAEAEVGTSVFYILFAIASTILGIVIGVNVGPSANAREGLSQGFVYNVYLRTAYGRHRHRIYRGLSESTMHEIANLLIDVAELERC
jgi:hypothetical protein